MLAWATFYVFAAFYVVKKFIQKVESHHDIKIQEAQNFFEILATDKEKVTRDKIILEKEASDIFTLYEMTREITKKLSEGEALEVFRSKLKENISLEDCRFISPLSSEYNEIQSSKEYFIFPLKTKRVKEGYLAFKGLQDKDKDKAIILSHQFALAFRRVELYKEVEELAITDSLTSVHTRRHFLGRFEEELRRSTSRKIDLSVLMIDVDHFKSFNDQYGHLVGDQILHAIGAILKENIREIDFIGRYGGEEFCVILPVTDRYGANFAAERMRVAVEEAQIKAYDTTLKVTVSIGIAGFPSDGKIVSELIDKADWALYRAKKKGRNCICAFGVYEESP